MKRRSSRKLIHVQELSAFRMFVLLFSMPLHQVLTDTSAAARHQHQRLRHRLFICCDKHYLYFVHSSLAFLNKDSSQRWVRDRRSQPVALSLSCTDFPRFSDSFKDIMDFSFPIYLGPENCPTFGLFVPAVSLNGELHFSFFVND